METIEQAEQTDNRQPAPELQEFSYRVVDIPKDSILHTRCYLCRKKQNGFLKLDEEHVIPKILFKPHPPKRYVKLQACPHCNQSVKKTHDDYVIRQLQMCSFVPNAYEGWRNAMRGFEAGHDRRFFAGHYK